MVDHDELTTLYEARRVRWIELARRYGAHDEAEDVVQDVMVAVLQGLEPDEGETLETLIAGCPPRSEGGLLRLIASNRGRKGRWRRNALSRGTLPARYPEDDTPMRMDVQRAVYATEDPEMVWHYYSLGETERELGVSRKISCVAVHKRLVRLAEGLRGALVSYGRGRRNGL